MYEEKIINIGVTGHRDILIDCVDLLKDKVKYLLNSIVSEFPGRVIQVISPIAEGADQLVAEVALELQLPLVVALPFSKEEYKKDFGTEAMREKFTALLNKATEVIELPLLKGNTTENIQEYNQNRGEQYAYVGAFVALQSDVLIGLWDGNTEEKIGGTSQIIRYARTGFPNRLINAPTINHRSIIYTIKTPRTSNEIPVKDYFKTGIIPLNKELTKQEERMLGVLISVSEELI